MLEGGELSDTQNWSPRLCEDGIRSKNVPETRYLVTGYRRRLASVKTCRLKDQTQGVILVRLKYETGVSKLSQAHRHFGIDQMLIEEIT